MNIKLRPHHLLCFAAFKGKGYTEEFIKKMKIMQARLLSDCYVELAWLTDDICSKCPNIDKPNCSSANGIVHKMDNAVLKLLEVKNKSQRSKAKNFYEILSRTQKKDIDRICGKCEWKKNKICKISVSKLKDFAEVISISVTCN